MVHGPSYRRLAHYPLRHQGYEVVRVPVRKIVISAVAVRIAIIAIVFATTRLARSPGKMSRTYRIEIKASARVKTRAISLIVEMVLFDIVRSCVI